MADLGAEQVHDAKIQIKVGDKTYAMRRIGVPDLKVILQALHDKMVDEAMLRRPVLVAGGAFGEVMAAALRYRATDQEMWDVVNSITGRTELLAKCMDITYDELMKIAAENGGFRWVVDATEALLTESGLWMPPEDGTSTRRPSEKPSTGKEMPPTFSVPSPDTPSNP